MLTVNPCSDVNASAVCQSVVEHASTVKHDGVLVVERFQRRGRTVIDRPHVHWVLNLSEQEAKAIEKKFSDERLDVKLTLVYDPRGLCWYLAKDPQAAFYIAREEDHTGSGTPPSAAMEQQWEGVPNVPEKERKKNQSPRLNTGGAVDLMAWLAERFCWKPFKHGLLNSMAISRLVGVGMTRAP